MPNPNDDRPKWPYLSREEAERHIQQEEMLLEFAQLFDYSEASDRAVAIVGPAFLDVLLGNALIEFMVDDRREVGKLLQPDGPLGSYGTRVRVCYCLGLIGPTVASDLGIVGKIRNRFAHDLRADFSDEKISQWCRALRWHKEYFAEPPPAATERDLFQVGVNQLVTHLIGIPSLARSQRRRPAQG